jgi:hypothetical protein
MQSAPGRRGLHSEVLGWIHSASTRTAHCPLHAAFYGVISAFLWRSASKYGAMQPGHCAVPVQRSLVLPGSWGLAVPSPKLALEVGHAGLVGELAQVRERRGGDSLRDSLGTRIERAVHDGAQGKQALHVYYEVFG